MTQVSKTTQYTSLKAEITLLNKSIRSQKSELNSIQSQMGQISRSLPESVRNSMIETLESAKTTNQSTTIETEKERDEKQAILNKLDLELTTGFSSSFNAPSFSLKLYVVAAPTGDEDEPFKVIEEFLVEDSYQIIQFDGEDFEAQNLSSRAERLGMFVFQSDVEVKVNAPSLKFLMSN